jgi:hypothetical protein
MVQGVGLQSLASSFRSMALTPLTPVTNWVAYASATNHTTFDPDHIYSSRPPTFAHPSSIVIGNGYILPATSVGDSILPGSFYLNDVLVAPDLVQSSFRLSINHQQLLVHGV